MTEFDRIVARNIADFVLDHYNHFETYPMDVEINDVVYGYDEYWNILESWLNEK